MHANTNCFYFKRGYALFICKATQFITLCYIVSLSYETQEMAEIPVGGDILITIKQDFVDMFTHHAIKCHHYWIKCRQQQRLR